MRQPAPRPTRHTGPSTPTVTLPHPTVHTPHTLLPAPPQVYVQHLIEEQADALWKLIGAGAHLYVCGATRMGADVATAFEHVFRERGNLAAAAAASLLHELQSEGRYITELWS